jgi:hypothetical protein
MWINCIAVCVSSISKKLLQHFHISTGMGDYCNTFHLFIIAIFREDIYGNKNLISLVINSTIHSKCITTVSMCGVDGIKHLKLMRPFRAWSRVSLMQILYSQRKLVS